MRWPWRRSPRRPARVDPRVGWTAAWTERRRAEDQHIDVTAVLAQLRAHRIDRFADMVDRAMRGRR